MIEVDTVRLSGIDRIAIDQQGGSGIRGQSADSAIRCDPVNTAGGGCHQSIAPPAQRPTDIIDLSNRFILPIFNHKKPIGVADIYLSVKGCNGQSPTRHAVLRQKIAIYRREFNSEDAIRRSPP